MYCPHCGVQVLPESAFCHGCGKELLKDAPSRDEPPATLEIKRDAPEPKSSAEPTFRGVRALNWIIVAVLVPGAALMLMRAPQPIGAFLIVLLMAFLVGTFLLTAILLSRHTFYFAGFPVGAYRNSLRKVAVAGNAVMGLFGVIGLIACIATQQFGPMLAMLLYAIPPIINIKSLRAISRSGV